LRIAGCGRSPCDRRRGREVFWVATWPRLAERRRGAYFLAGLLPASQRREDEERSVFPGRPNPPQEWEEEQEGERRHEKESVGDSALRAKVTVATRWMGRVFLSSAPPVVVRVVVSTR
jgi:hypothetical protein